MTTYSGGVVSRIGSSFGFKPRMSRDFPFRSFRTPKMIRVGFRFVKDSDAARPRVSSRSA